MRGKEKDIYCIQRTTINFTIAMVATILICHRREQHRYEMAINNIMYTDLANMPIHGKYITCLYQGTLYLRPFTMKGYVLYRNNIETYIGNLSNYVILTQRKYKSKMINVNVSI